MTAMRIITFENGVRKVQHGPSRRQLKKAHYTGKCGAFCGYCITEVEEYYKKEGLFNET